MLLLELWRVWARYMAMDSICGYLLDAKKDLHNKGKDTGLIYQMDFSIPETFP